MIPRAFITHWKQTAPWISDAQVEQDLVISRSLVEIFSDDLLADNLAFRGGTALHKLYFAPAPRYSEDIDLVQIRPEPIGPVIDRLRTRLPILETPKIRQKDRNTTLIFRFETEVEPVINMRVKVEINWPGVMNAFHQIMEIDGTPVTDKQLRLNLEEKLDHPDFPADIQNLLRPEINFEPKGLRADFLWSKS